MRVEGGVEGLMGEDVVRGRHGDGLNEDSCEDGSMRGDI